MMLMLMLMLMLLLCWLESGCMPLFAVKQKGDHIVGNHSTRVDNGAWTVTPPIILLNTSFVIYSGQYDASPDTKKHFRAKSVIVLKVALELVPKATLQHLGAGR